LLTFRNLFAIFIIRHLIVRNTLHLTFESVHAGRVWKGNRGLEELVISSAVVGNDHCRRDKEPLLTSDSRNFYIIVYPSIARETPRFEQC